MGITDGIKRETPEHGAQETAQSWDREATEDHAVTFADLVETANRQAVIGESGNPR
jgi:hypothetical protein